MTVFDGLRARIPGSGLLTLEKTCETLQLDESIIRGMARHGTLTPRDEKRMIFDRKEVEQYKRERAIRDSYMAELYETSDEIARREREWRRREGVS